MQEGTYQERRLVTVLFADFVGFTTLAEELDPEVLQETVSAIFEDLAEEAITYDGTIEKFIGDAIFVVFGAPVAHEDDPQRALRCALGMRREFADHAARVKKERGVELGLRIGVHTGLVVAGHVRSVAEYGVMGDTVNTAARLEAAAAPGEIYVTEETFRLANRDFAFREVGPMQLKGKERAIMAYALGGERGEDRVRIEVSAPLVGRWMELSRLDLAFQSARLGRSEVVVITGEPGIGKSRLVSEFVGLASPSHAGASTPAGDGETRAADAPRVLRWTFSRVNQRSYAGFMEPLLNELGIEPTSLDAMPRLETVVREMGFAAPATVAPILAQFLHLPGAGEVAEGSEERQREMYLAVFDVLAALARTRPILYVLEDLHYADPSSLDLLGFVTARATGTALLFLLAHRLGPGAPELRASRANFSQLVLQPLSDEEAARIVETTVPMPEELRDRIVARAGGNPFFIEESVRSLIESGVVEKDETSGSWRLARLPAGLEVPATLHAVVAARIDRLPPLAKEAIQLASVIGVRFGDRVMRAAGGDRVADAVDQLIAADLVVDAAPGERREGRYRFKHAVTQEVAYNTLLVRRRVELHRTVAGAMERVLGEQLREFYGALAHHYLLAEVPDKAAEYAWHAAQRALAIHAHVEVLRSAEQALELFEQLGDVERAVEALYLLARIRRYRGEYDAALAAYERALALLEQRAPGDQRLRREAAEEPTAEDRARIASVLAHMAELCTRWDAKHPDLDGLIARGLALVGEERSRERVLLLAAKAFMPRRAPKATAADWEDALETAKDALAIAEELGLLREVSLCLDAVGYAYAQLGRFREAYTVNRRRLPIAQSLQDNDELIDAHNMCAQSATVLDDLDEAIEHAARARELASSTEKPRLGLAALQAEVAALLLAARFRDVLDRVAMRTQMQTGRTGKEPLTLVMLGIAAAAALASPDEEDLRDELTQGEAPPWIVAGADLSAAIWGQRRSESAYHGARSAGIPRTELELVTMGPLMVVAAARWGIEDDPFEDRVAAAVERSGHARGRALLAQAQALRGAARGEHAKAETLLLDAIQAFTTLRLDHERAVALIDRARTLGALGRAADAEAQLEEARGIAERLEAAALLATLDAEPLRA